MPGIFISHTHGDQLIADALTVMVEGLFGKNLQVNYSSRKELDGGIAPGEDWFRWIVEQVQKADVALILLTPSSIQKPWVLWEAGAVAGAAFAVTSEKARVFPVTFGLRAAEIPTPFARTQLVSGTDESEMLKLLEEFFDRFGTGDKKESMRFGENRGKAVKAYLEQIRPILLRLPLTVTESAVQEWLVRLTELEKNARSSEAQVMEDWLDVAFGRDTSDRKRPFDVRIHRRLGDLYLSSGKSDSAARQFQLARELAPRDIFLLRRLGKAYLDLKEVEKVEEVLSEIEALDPQAFTRNVENAAFKARYLETKGNTVGAKDVLATAFQNMPTSYYLGDLLGQAYLSLGELDRATVAYRQVLRVISDLRERNVWTWATLLSAALVANDSVEMEHAISGLLGDPPGRGELESIERGVIKICTALKRDPNDVLTLLRATERRR